VRTPKVPEPFTERQVVPDIQRGEAETRVPSGAFGGVSPRLEEEEKTTSNLMDRIQENADNFQTSAIKNQILDKVNEFSGTAKSSLGMNSIPYSPTKEDSLTSKFKEQINDFANNASQNNKRVQKEIQPFVGHLMASLDGQMQLHVAKQTTLAEGKTFADNIKSLLNMAGAAYNDPKTRDYLLQQLDEASEKYANFRGQPEAADAQKATQRYNFQTAIVHGYLSNLDPQGAKKYIEELKSKGELVEGPKLASLEKMANTGSLKRDANDFYNKASMVMKDSEGLTDINKVIGAIDKSQLSPLEKDQYKTIALAKYGQDKKQFDTAKLGRWNQFQDVYGKALKAGVPYEKASTIPASIGGSEGEQLRMQRVIDRDFKANGTGGLNIYFGGTGPQVQHFHEIMQEINLGNLKPEQIPLLEKAGSLTRKQFDQAMKAAYQVNINGPDTRKNIIFRRLNQMASDTFGNDQESINNFRNHMEDIYQGIGREGDVKSVMEDAKNYLEGEKGQASPVWKDMAQPPEKYVQPADRRKMYVEMGKDVTDGLMKTLYDKLGRMPTVFDFGNFMDEFGGPQALQRYYPVNNAIRSIIRYNSEHQHQIPLTKDQVDKAINMYSNGVF